mgnify:CR=1 FL=1
MGANEQVIEQDWRTIVRRHNGRPVVRELRGQVTRGQAMGYRVRIDHIEYVGHRDGRPFSLVDALAAVHGVGNTRVLAPDGRTVKYLGRRKVYWPDGETGRRVLDRYRIGHAAQMLCQRKNHN